MRPRAGGTTLILVPTELERARLADQGGFPAGTGLVATIGFGAVAAAARTSALLAELTPSRVVLVGIAGTFDAARLPVGSATEFDAVAIEGIGVGEGERLLAPPALGFPQWPGASAQTAIHDRIALTPFVPRAGAARLLLTTCAASDSAAHAERRRARAEAARAGVLEADVLLAEDMEGFGVALACALADTPLAIVRGISNVVGDRDPAHWRIPSALAAARELALAHLSR